MSEQLEDVFAGGKSYVEARVGGQDVGSITLVVGSPRFPLPTEPGQIDSLCDEYL